MTFISLSYHIHVHIHSHSHVISYHIHIMFTSYSHHIIISYSCHIHIIFHSYSDHVHIISISYSYYFISKLFPKKVSSEIAELPLLSGPSPMTRVALPWHLIHWFIGFLMKETIYIGVPPYPCHMYDTPINKLMKRLTALHISPEIFIFIFHLERWSFDANSKMRGIMEWMERNYRNWAQKHALFYLSIQ